MIGERWTEWNPTLERLREGDLEQLTAQDEQLACRGKTDSPQPWPWTKLIRGQSLDRWILIATVIGFVALGWIHLHRTSIWYDEAITLLTTAGHSKLDRPIDILQFKPTADLGKILHDLYTQDVHPPLYFWTLAIWRTVFGPSLEVARVLSLLFSVMTLVLLYRLAMDFLMTWPSVPVVVYALSSAGLRYAYDARPYAMATSLIVLTLVLTHRKSKWTGLCAAAAVATH